MSTPTAVALDFDTLPDVAMGTCEGDLGLADVEAAAERMIERLAALASPPPHMLWDLTGARLDLDSVELNRLARFITTRASEPRGRTAYVVDADLAYGLMRVYQAIRSEHDDQIGVFRDRDEAVTWLRGR